LVCLAAVTACTAEPETSAFEAAARQLVSDGDELLAFFDLRHVSHMSRVRAIPQEELCQ
jgi:hypothetical protein